MILSHILLVVSLLCSVLPNSYGAHIHVGVNPEGNDGSTRSSDTEVHLHHSLDKNHADDGGVLVLEFRAFERVVRVNLQRVNSELAGSNTPVFVARSSSDGVTFEKTPDQTLGKAVTLYQDRLTDSAIAVTSDDDGSPVFVGTVDGFSVNYKPKSGRKKRAIKRRSIGGLTASELHVVSEISRKRRDVKEASYADLQKELERQGEASNASTVYPQLLVVTDYGTEVSDATSLRVDFAQKLVYILAFFNGVDLAFQQLSNPQVRLHISGIVINSDPAAAPYIENNRNATGAIDAVAALGQMGEFYADHLTDLPPDSYNIIVTLLNDYICDHHEEDFCSPLLAGVSSLDKRCVDNHPSSSMVAIVEDNSVFSGIRTAIHELGHIMGAEHDGEEEAEDCPFADGYLMAKYNDSSDVSLTWSKCSRRYFSEELGSDGFDCLRNPPNWEKDGSPLPLILPSDLSSLNRQCIALGYVRNCQGPQNCQALTCSNTTYAFSLDCEKAGIPAAQGSSCGVAQYCINGECVPESGSKK